MTIEDLKLAELSTDALKEIIARVQYEITHRAGTTAEIRVTVSFDSYNEKRYSKPWIARVTSWPVGRPAVLAFGTFIGAPGCAGPAEIHARAGDIIRFGQHDNRNRNGSTARWGIAQADGTVKEVTMQEARAAHMESAQ